MPLSRAILARKWEHPWGKSEADPGRIILARIIDDDSSENTLSTEKPALPHDPYVISYQEPDTRVCRNRRNYQAVGDPRRSTPKLSAHDELSANKPILPSDPYVTSRRDSRNDQPILLSFWRSTRHKRPAPSCTFCDHEGVVKWDRGVKTYSTLSVIDILICSVTTGTFSNPPLRMSRGFLKQDERGARFICKINCCKLQVFNRSIYAICFYLYVYLFVCVSLFHTYNYKSNDCNMCACNKAVKHIET